jgi:hypothetical protein
MTVGSGREKAALWRDRFRRQSRSGLPVARFCSEEGVSVPSFYAWRKKMASPGPTSRSTPKPACQRAAPARVFQSLTVAAARPALSIRLPGGVELQVPAENLDLIRVVIGELARVTAGGVPC